MYCSYGKASAKVRLRTLAPNASFYVILRDASAIDFETCLLFLLALGYSQLRTSQHLSYDLLAPFLKLYLSLHITCDDDHLVLL
jgi:hypothetical protein